MKKQSISPLDVASNAVEGLGWAIDSDEEVLFQDSIYFITPGQIVPYHANLVKHTDSILHLELMVEMRNIPEVKRTEYYRLLNLLNNDIALGSLSCVLDEESSAEFLVYRAQFFYDEKKGTDEETLSGFLKNCVHVFDLYLPNISDFLVAKMRGYLGEDGLIESVSLQMTPEDTVQMILAGPTVGRA